jgi:hypothetical protein
MRDTVGPLLGALAVVAFYFFMSGDPPRDDCDTAQGRCGMKVRRDALTGCEYLETWLGGITPRMNGDGKQVCRNIGTGASK